MEILKKGCKGDSVKQLQIALGITPADGIFGSITENAVKKYQKENKLTVDGIVGKNTLNALLNKGVKTNSPKIDNHFMSSSEYLNGKYKNEYLVLHHTAGHDNPYQVVDCWNKDTRGRVATEFVIGGQNAATGRKTYDGQIVRSFPEGNQGYHIGASGSSYMTTHSVGIETCNIGWIENGKTYVGTSAIKDQIVTLKNSFRGHKTWHRYSDAQLKSLKELMIYIANRDNIDLHKGLYQWIKKEGEKAFDFKEDAYYGKVKGGVVTHANIRKDKNDMFPQPELIDMILTL